MLEVTEICAHHALKLADATRTSHQDQNWNRHLQVHDHALVHLLPQVSPEDLDEGYLEGGDLAVHEDARQVQLHLETHIHIGTVDGG